MSLNLSLCHTLSLLVEWSFTRAWSLSRTLTQSAAQLLLQAQPLLFDELSDFNDVCLSALAAFCSKGAPSSIHSLIVCELFNALAAAAFRGQWLVQPDAMCGLAVSEDKVTILCSYESSGLASLLSAAAAATTSAGMFLNV